jgi:hypothetical protein
LGNTDLARKLANAASGVDSFGKARLPSIRPFFRIMTMKA